MGYYTAYSLEVLNAGDFKDKSVDEIEREVALALAKLDQFCWGTEEQQKSFEEAVANCTFPIDEVLGYDTMKWYNHEDDMVEISKKFPKYKFRLHGEGEDPDDFWDDYYYNGKFSHCRGYKTYDPAPDWAFRKEE